MIHTMTSAEVMKILRADGWYVHNVRGSHFQLKHPVKAGKIMVPHPRSELPRGTLRSIFRQAGLPMGD
jgi:predicted RNA binding protein YcfA (HicA-like mRNA interferase family)